MTGRIEREQQALELHRSGVPYPAIKERLHYRSVSEAEAAVSRARLNARTYKSMAEAREIELDRLDRLQQGMWLKAARGDEAAVDRVIALGMRRLQILAMAEEPTATPMVTAYLETVKHLKVTAIDAAAVAAGRRLAERIDASIGSLDPAAETKALYLIPHFMNVLTMLGATQEARASLGAVASEVATAPVNDLEAFKASKGIK